MSLESKVERFRGCVFRRSRGDFPCSAPIISLVRATFCNRVEHSDGVAAALPGCKGTHKGRPYRQSPLCNRVEHANGPIRFRQQLSSSTSGGVMSLESKVERFRGCVFPGHEAASSQGRADRFRCRQQVLFVLSRFFL